MPSSQLLLPGLASVAGKTLTATFDAGHLSSDGGGAGVGWVRAAGADENNSRLQAPRVTQQCGRKRERIAPLFATPAPWPCHSVSEMFGLELWERRGARMPPRLP
jgi:hypothetical protein